jgi:hypothetical protein
MLQTCLFYKFYDYSVLFYIGGIKVKALPFYLQQTNAELTAKFRHTYSYSSITSFFRKHLIIESNRKVSPLHIFKIFELD